MGQPEYEEEILITILSERYWDGNLNTRFVKVWKKLTRGLSYSMGYKHHSVKTGGIPVDYIAKFAHKIPVFIETGTAGGESVRAVSHLFTHCHSIEIVNGRPSGDFPKNVTLHEGDSAKLLKEIADPYKKEYILFWLDAHWSEPHESKEGEEECPLLDEIKALQGFKAVIMIDDARLFLGPPPWPNDPQKWPKFKDVIYWLITLFPDHITTVVDDYIVCIPDEMKDIFINEWRGRFLERYPTDEMKLKQSVRDSFNALTKYIE